MQRRDAQRVQRGLPVVDAFGAIQGDQHVLIQRLGLAGAGPGQRAAGAERPGRRAEKRFARNLGECGLDGGIIGAIPRQHFMRIGRAAFGERIGVGGHAQQHTTPHDPRRHLEVLAANSIAIQRVRRPGIATGDVSRRGAALFEAHDWHRRHPSAIVMRPPKEGARWHCRSFWTAIPAPMTRSRSCSPSPRPNWTFGPSPSPEAMSGWIAPWPIRWR